VVDRNESSDLHAEAAEMDVTEETPGNGTAADEGQGRDLAAEYLEALQRERANFINFRRRSEQERAETIQYASANLLKRLLPIVDDFDRALAAIPEEERKNNRWVEGVELIARKLHTVLEQEGVEPIDALGQPFDPNLHEAVAFEDNAEGNDQHEDTVAEVFAKGYKLRDRVLRPAMVKVARNA
jgi:molecular chaperone GrpE